MTRVCVHCETPFETKHSHKKYCSSPCQIAASNRVSWDNTKRSPIGRCRKLLEGAKGRSKSQDRPIDITLDDLVELWYRQEEKCAITRIPFNLDYPEKPKEPRFDAPSIDRIVPELGYTRGNVRLVIYQINMAIGPYGLDRLLETIKHIGVA